MSFCCGSFGAAVANFAFHFTPGWLTALLKFDFVTKVKAGVSFDECLVAAFRVLMRSLESQPYPF